VSKDTFCIIIYVEPTPLSLDSIAREIPGEVSDHALTAPCLVIDELGKIQCWGQDRKMVEPLVFDVLDKIKRTSGQATVIAVGKTNQSGQTAVLAKPKHVTTVIARETELIIRDLGLLSEKTKDISQVVANEMLSNLAIKNNVTTDSNIPFTSRLFTGWFLINEKLKKKLASTYMKKTQRYSATFDANRSSVIRTLVAKLGEKKEEIIIAITVGLIVEACIRAILYIFTTVHYERGTSSIKELELPETLMGNIKSQRSFSASEIARALNREEWSTIAMLNTLKEIGLLKLIDMYDRTYKGTGVTKFPNVMGSTTFPLTEEIIASDGFHKSFSMKLYDKGGFIWRPDRDIMTLIEKLWQEA